MSSSYASSDVRPCFRPNGTAPESGEIQSLIKTLSLLEHPEGGYYAETDRDARRVPNPFLTSDPGTEVKNNLDYDTTRSASTTIYYLLTPSRPQGNFHRNKARTVHTLHRGRGRYVLIHPSSEEEAGTGAHGLHRVEVFTVGPNVDRGERLQWIVEGDVYKASFLLANDGTKDGGHDQTSTERMSGGLLISETVVPGFEFKDHDFLEKEALAKLVGQQTAKDLEWLVKA